MRSGGLTALVAAPMLVLGGCLSTVVLLAKPGPAAGGTCGLDATSVTATTAVPGDVAGYSGPQLANAAAIINAGQALGLPVRAQTIAVMTAMGESSLTVLDRGDAAGPDSRGLFQQRDNGAWGTLADRMDPTTSATNFYAALIRVPGWEALPPTIAAHRTQRNADPFHYERHWDAAVAVVEAFAGSDLPAIAAGTGALPCTGLPPAPGTGTGWTTPAAGPLTSGYGTRVNPVTGVTRLHAGTDIGAPCEAPIYAAAPGIVVKAGPAAGYGNLMVIDHPDTPGTTTRYAHMPNTGVLVTIGQAVTTGQQIGRVGTTGNSTGCHLHYEIRTSTGLVDPVPFHTQQGAPLG